MVARKGFMFASVIVISLVETFLCELPNIHPCAIKMLGFIKIFFDFQVALIAFNILGETLDGRELNTVVSALLSAYLQIGGAVVP